MRYKDKSHGYSTVTYTVRDWRWLWLRKMEVKRDRKGYPGA
jgi:hypothetical protein